jgi:hypothetical protein
MPATASGRIMIEASMRKIAFGMPTRMFFWVFRRARRASPNEAGRPPRPAPRIGVTR